MLVLVYDKDKIELRPLKFQKNIGLKYHLRRLKRLEKKLAEVSKFAVNTSL
jgi:hypothetical protein